MNRTVIAALVLSACGGKIVPTVIADGSLTACPSTPNCVSSLAEPTDAEHWIEPFPGTMTVAEMTEWMNGRKRCEVLDSGDVWVHAACRTAILRFTDDIALLVDEADDVTHVRSSSRVGHSDLGKNRKRVEDMQQEWAERVP